MSGFYKQMEAQEESTSAADAADEALTQPEPEDDNPIQVNEPVEVGSLADQESGILPAATKVVSSVKKASIKTMLIDNKLPEHARLDATTLDTNKWTTKSLHLELQIGQDGIDGQGAYAGKVLFCDLVLAINMVGLKEAHARKVAAAQIQGKSIKPFNEVWWNKESRFLTRQFYQALGIDITNPPPADDDFLVKLRSCTVMHDITRVKDDFRGAGEFKNEVKNFRAAG